MSVSRKRRKLMTNEDRYNESTKFKTRFSKNSSLQDDNNDNNYEVVDLEAEIFDDENNYENDNNETDKVNDEKLLDAAMLKWFLQVRDRGEPISGLIVQKKARVLSKKLNASSKFQASRDWLYKFMKRYGIQNFPIRGNDSVENEEFSQYMKERIECNNASLDNIYNADESGIYWRTLASCLLNLTSEPRKPQNQDSRDRLSGLFCSNANGTHRIPLLLVGKAVIPRNLHYFKMQNVNNRLKFFQSLDVFYTHQNHSLVDREIFLLWFKDIFIPHVLEHQRVSGATGKVILLLDTAPCHAPLNELNLINENFEVVFLHFNIIPRYQPMRHDLIFATKKLYKKILLRHLLSNKEIEGVDKLIKNLDFRECFAFLSIAWNSLKSANIQEAWRQVLGDVFNELQDPLFLDKNDKLDSAVFALDESLSFPREIVDELSHLLLRPNSSLNKIKACLLKWFEDDNDDCGWEALTDDEIIQFVKNMERETEIKNEDSITENRDPLEIPETQEVVAEKLTVTSLIKSEVEINSFIIETKLGIEEREDTRINENRNEIFLETEDIDIEECKIGLEGIIQENTNARNEEIKETAAEANKLRIDEIVEETDDIDIEECKIGLEDIIEENRNTRIEEIDETADEDNKITLEEKIRKEETSVTRIEEIEDVIIEESRNTRKKITEEIIIDDSEDIIIDESRNVRNDTNEKTIIEESPSIENKRTGEIIIEDNEDVIIQESEKITNQANEDIIIEESETRDKATENIIVDESGNIRVEETIVEENNVVEIGVAEITIGGKEVKKRKKQKAPKARRNEETSTAEAFRGLMKFKQWMQTCNESKQKHYYFAEELENLLK